MNFSLVRQERIAKLENRRSRIINALKNFPYTKTFQYLEDVAALEKTEKEIQIQQAYLLYES